MKILGKYQSNLNSFHYRELYDRLKQLLKDGEYAGGKAFDLAAAQALQQQGQDFTSLPTISAGSRTTDESINHPLTLLQARFKALLSESESFDDRAAMLLSVLEKDTDLIEQILANSPLESWADGLPRVEGALRFLWDFAGGFGAVTGEVAPTDPVTGIEYTTRPERLSVVEDGELRAGLVPPIAPLKVPVKYLHWEYQTEGTPEELYGQDWTKLTLLEAKPRLDFVETPHVHVLTPANGNPACFEVAGAVSRSNLPVYLRTLFHPRRNELATQVTNVAPGWGTKFVVKPGTKLWVEGSYSCDNGAGGSAQVLVSFFDRANNPILINGVAVKAGSPAVAPSLQGVTEKISWLVEVPAVDGLEQASAAFVVNGGTAGLWHASVLRAHAPMDISEYAVQPDEVRVFAGNEAFMPQDDFTVNDDGLLTFFDIPDGLSVTVRYTEYYPAYQCSVNGAKWSDVIMLDPLRPYPDEATSFPPLKIEGQLFPVVDETNHPLDMQFGLRAGAVMPTDFLIRLETPSAGTYGAIATLEVELERPAFLDGLEISPFVNFPMTLVRLETQGFTTKTRATQFAGSQLIDRKATLRFERTLCRRLFLTFAQENYTWKSHTVDAPDKLRRELLARIQSVLPFAAQRASVSAPRVFSGAQYEFGMEAIQGVALNFQLPGVLVSGGFKIQGLPDLIKLDADTHGDVDFFVCFTAYDGNGQVIDQNHVGVPIPAAGAIPFPFSESLADRGAVGSAEIFLKIVMRSEDAVVERFLLQVAKHA